MAYFIKWFVKHARLLCRFGGVVGNPFDQTYRLLGWLWVTSPQRTQYYRVRYCTVSGLGKNQTIHKASLWEIQVLIQGMILVNCWFDFCLDGLADGRITKSHCIDSSKNVVSWPQDWMLKKLPLPYTSGLNHLGIFSYDDHPSRLANFTINVYWREHMLLARLLCNLPEGHIEDVYRYWKFCCVLYWQMLTLYESLHDCHLDLSSTSNRDYFTVNLKTFHV